MAVDSGAASNQMLKSPKNKDTKNKKDPISSPAKRNKSPGIRLVGGRIYDSVNGKTCHQCRQKTRDFAAACTNQRNGKPCPIMYCHKCLLNRYGEKAEEVAASGKWCCPKCKGICNCSVCMKKRGHQPTGILYKTAKATGFSSVSEMLLKGAQQITNETVDALVADLPKQQELAPSPRKRGKENSFDGKVDANLPNDITKKSKKVKKVHKGNKDDGTPISQSPDKRKLEQEALVEKQDCNKKLGAEDTASCGAEKSNKKKRDRSDELANKKNGDEILKEKSVNDGKKKPKKSKKNGLGNDDIRSDASVVLENKKDDEGILKEKSINDGKKKPKKSKKNGLGNDDIRSDASLARRTSPRKLAVSSRISNQEARPNVGVDDEDTNCRIMATKKDFVKPLEKDTIKEDEINTANTLVVLKQHNAVFLPEIPLPLGTELNTVAGIDVSIEDVGNALQFLEFCAAFGKILEVKKGQPEHVLQDLFHGRMGRRGKFSVTVQFHIHLLSILKTEQGEECGELSPSVGKSLWFDALKEYLSESESILKAQGLDCLDGASDYESLEASEKLRLLNFLCDEILGTEKVRSWMDEQNTKLAEKVKEARQKVSAAKDKEKTLKQKMKDDIAKAIIAKHGASLSISEHEAIISDIKRKAAEAHAKVVLESNGLLLENSRSCNAVRVEPILVGCGGNAYWKLNCCGKSDVLHQDVGKGDTLTLNEKWFAIDDEGKEAVEKHICSLRGKKLRF